MWKVIVVTDHTLRHTHTHHIHTHTTHPTHTHHTPHTHTHHIHTYTHTHTHTNYVRTSLDEGTARHRHLQLTTPNIQNIKASMHPAGFEPAVLASARPQTHVLSGAFTAIGNTIFYFYLLSESFNCLHSQEILGITLHYSVQEALHKRVSLSVDDVNKH